MNRVLLLALLMGARQAPSPVIRDFQVFDQQGAPRHLREFHDKKLVVVVFLGTECPQAKLYAPRLNVLADQFAGRGVALVGINSNESDKISDLQHFADAQRLKFPLWKDPRGIVADQFGASRQLEVFVLDTARTVKYHGRVDDQYEPGLRRSEPHRHDLHAALDELLAGKSVSVSETTFAGCFLQRPASEQSIGKITYARDVAPILEARCVECHRAGQIGPFALTKFEEAKAWSATMRERIEDGSMPPWHADGLHGRFANERRLTDAEKKTLFTWIDSGMPFGNSAELPRRRQFNTDWNLGTPDKVLTMPEPYKIPAEGVLDNIAVELDPGFKEDTWVRGTEVRPGIAVLSITAQSSSARPD